MPAFIFGTDEFKIDIRKSRIRIPIYGWINKEDIAINYDLKSIKWIALSSTKEGYNLVVSYDIEPFDEIEDNPLYINGQVFGVPYGIDLKFP
jgi:hypothetical protein